jgi:hypothetical protein
MKDRLGTSAWVNRAPRNMTQTYYTRFLKGSSAELKSSFTEGRDRFNRMMEDALKTRYSELLGGQNAKLLSAGAMGAGLQ